MDMEMEVEALRPRHRFTVKEYNEMAQLGLLDPDARVELIDGDIIEMPPIGPAHATIVTRLSTLLTRAVGDWATVRTQSPILVGQTSEPEPDLALVKPRDVYYHRHPEAEDILLVCEVSQSSAAYDRIKKGRLYSRAWIPEYWLIDIPRQQVEVYRSPGPDGYREKQELHKGDSVSPLALPELTIQVGQILGG
jgi:Uma2 family endonuclease